MSRNSNSNRDTINKNELEHIHFSNITRRSKRKRTTMDQSNEASSSTFQGNNNFFITDPSQDNTYSLLDRSFKEEKNKNQSPIENFSYITNTSSLQTEFESEVNEKKIKNNSQPK